MLVNALGRTPTREELVQWLMDCVHLLMDYAPDPPGLEVFQTVQWSIGGQCGFSVSPITGATKGCGDCEDLATLLVCLCLCLGITARVKWIEQKGSPLNHVAAVVLFDDQRPDDPKAWRCTDATIPGARVGETPYEALDRVGPGFRSRIFGLSEAAGGVFAQAEHAPAGLIRTNLGTGGASVSSGVRSTSAARGGLSISEPVTGVVPSTSGRRPSPSLSPFLTPTVRSPVSTDRPSGRIVVRGAPAGITPARAVIQGGVSGNPADSQPLTPQSDGTLAVVWPVSMGNRLQVGAFDVPVTVALNTDSVYDYTPDGLVFRPEVTRLAIVAETGRVVVENVGPDSLQATTGNTVADNLQHGTRYLVELTAEPLQLERTNPVSVFGAIDGVLNPSQSTTSTTPVTIPLTRSASGAFEGNVMPGRYSVLVYAEESSPTQRQATRRLVYTAAVDVVAGQTSTVTRLNAVEDAYGPPGPGPGQGAPPIAPSVSAFAASRAAAFAAGHDGIVNVAEDGRRNGYLSDLSMADPRIPRDTKARVIREFDSIPFDLESLMPTYSAQPGDPPTSLMAPPPRPAPPPDSLRLFAVFYKGTGLTFVAMKPSEFEKLLRDLGVLGWAHSRADGSHAFELTV